MEVTQVHQEAVVAAQQATQTFLAQNGDRDCCGFASVKIYGVKLSTKLGKEFVKIGFRKCYSGGIELWNPSGSHTQSITAKEAGADAYVDVFRKHFPEMKIYSWSRMD